jgi:putative transposase
MENCRAGQKALYAYSMVLRKEFSLVEKLNSMACQASAERALTKGLKDYHSSEQIASRLKSSGKESISGDTQRRSGNWKQSREKLNTGSTNY